MQMFGLLFKRHDTEVWIEWKSELFLTDQLQELLTGPLQRTLPIVILYIM